MSPSAPEEPDASVADGSVRLRSVTKTYRHHGGGLVPALDDVTVTLGPADTIGVIGPNGSGKTTLLKVIAGITAPDRGRVERRGHTLALIELGAGLHPDLTGAENVGFLGSLAGLSRRQIIERRERIVEFSGLGDDIHRPVKHYSSGMLARLGFSISAHAEPDLLLVDEVLAVGDLEFQRRCLARMAELRHDGCTVVVVTHDLATVTSICDRAVLLEHGRLLAEGAPAEVVFRYLGIDPFADDASAEVHLRVPTGAVAAPGPLELELTGVGTRRFRAGTVHVEVSLPVHPAASATGITDPFPVAVARLEGEWSGLTGSGTVRLALGLDGLAPGRYLVSCTVGAEGEPPARSDTTEFRIAGDPGRSLAVPLRTGREAVVRRVERT